MHDSQDNCILCDRKAGCFEHLSREELEEFHNCKSTISYNKGETIIKQGTQFTHVISFNEGLAKISVEQGHKKDVLIGILKPSEILGGPGMFADNRYSFTVSALTECKICLIDVATFKKAIRNNQKFADIFLASFSERFTLTINRLINLSNKQMHGRVADALLYFADVIYKSDKFELALSRQELANFTGMSKESISRILKDFYTDNVINTKGRFIEILNKEKLAYFQQTG